MDSDMHVYVVSYIEKDIHDPIIVTVFDNAEAARNMFTHIDARVKSIDRVPVYHDMMFD